MENPEYSIGEFSADLMAQELGQGDEFDLTSYIKNRKKSVPGVADPPPLPKQQLATPAPSGSFDLTSYIKQREAASATQMLVPSYEVLPGGGLDMRGTIAPWLGTPYVWGGNAQKKGVDCSGFTCGVYADHGVKLPRTAREQFKKGKAVDPKKDLQPGDAVFFDMKGKGDITHVGVYVGNNQMAHASSSGGVKYEALTPYWQKRMKGARRFLDTSSLLPMDDGPASVQLADGSVKMFNSSVEAQKYVDAENAKINAKNAEIKQRNDWVADREKRVKESNRLQGLIDEYSRRKHELKNKPGSIFESAAEAIRLEKEIDRLTKKQTDVWKGYSEPAWYGPEAKKQQKELEAQRKQPVSIAPKGKKVIANPQSSLHKLWQPLPPLTDETFHLYDKRKIDLNLRITHLESDIRKMEKAGKNTKPQRKALGDLYETERNLRKSMGQAALLLGDPEIGYYATKAREQHDADRIEWGNKPLWEQYGRLILGGVQTGAQGLRSGLEAIGVQGTGQKTWIDREDIGKPKTLPRAFLEMVAEGIGTSVPGVATGILTAGGGAALLGVTSGTALASGAAAGGITESFQNFGHTYKEALDAGFSPAEAKSRATRGFFMEVGPNILLNRLQIDPRGFIGVLKRAGMEGLEEVVQDKVQAHVLGRDFGLKEAGLTFGVGAFVGSVLTATDSIMRAFANIDKLNISNAEKREMKAQAFDMIRGSVIAAQEGAMQQLGITEAEIRSQPLPGYRFRDPIVRQKGEDGKDYNQYGDPIERTPSGGWGIKPPWLVTTDSNGKQVNVTPEVEDQLNMFGAPPPIPSQEEVVEEQVEPPKPGELFTKLDQDALSSRQREVADVDPMAGFIALQGTRGQEFADLSPDEIGVQKDPPIQYKSGTDEEGVGDSLKGVETFDPDQAKYITVWRRLDGSLKVIHGHHRLWLAKTAKFFKRLIGGTKGGVDVVGIQDADRKIRAEILDESKGWTLRMVRALGVVENLRDNRGTAADAAAVIRDIGMSVEGMKAWGVPLKGGLGRNAAGLVNLHPNALKHLLSNKNIDEAAAAGVGAVMRDAPEAFQIAALTEVARGGVKGFENGRIVGIKILDRGEIGFKGQDEGQISLMAEDQSGTWADVVGFVTEETDIETAVKKRLKQQKSSLEKPMDAELLEGENIDAETREQMAGEIGEAMTKMDIIFRHDPQVTALIRDLGKDLYGKKTTLKEAVDKVTKFLKDNPHITDRTSGEIIESGKHGKFAHLKEEEPAPPPAPAPEPQPTAVGTKPQPEPANRQKVRVYHGSSSLEMRGPLSPSKAVETRGAVFFTDNEDVADIFRYPREYGEVLYDETPGPLLERDIEFSNPLVLEGDEAQRFTEDTAFQGDIVRKAKSENYDAIIVKDVMEGVGMTVEKGTTYVVFDASQISDPAVEGAKPKPEPAAETGFGGSTAYPVGTTVTHPQKGRGRVVAESAADNETGEKRVFLVDYVDRQHHAEQFNEKTAEEVGLEVSDDQTDSVPRKIMKGDRVRLKMMDRKTGNMRDLEVTVTRGLHTRGIEEDGRIVDVVDAIEVQQDGEPAETFFMDTAIGRGIERLNGPPIEYQPKTKEPAAGPTPGERVATTETVPAPAPQEMSMADAMGPWSVVQGKYSIPNASVSAKELTQATVGFNGKHPHTGELWNRSPLETTISLFKYGWRFVDRAKNSMSHMESRDGKKWYFDNDEVMRTSTDPLVGADGGARKFARWFQNAMKAAAKSETRAQDAKDLNALITEVNALAKQAREGHTSNIKATPEGGTDATPTENAIEAIKESARKAKARESAKKTRERGAINPRRVKVDSPLLEGENAKTLYAAVTSKEFGDAIETLWRVNTGDPVRVMNDIAEAIRATPGFEWVTGKRDVAFVMQEAYKRGDWKPKKGTEARWEQYFKHTLLKIGDLPIGPTGPHAASKPNTAEEKAAAEEAVEEGTVQRVRNEEALERAAEAAGTTPDEVKIKSDTNTVRIWGEAAQGYTEAKGKATVDRAYKGKALTPSETATAAMYALDASNIVQALQLKVKRLERGRGPKAQKEYEDAVADLEDARKEVMRAWAAYALAGTQSSTSMRMHQLFVEKTHRKDPVMAALMQIRRWKGEKMSAEELEATFTELSEAQAAVTELEQTKESLLSEEGYQRVLDAQLLLDKFAQEAGGKPTKEALMEARRDLAEHFSRPLKQREARISKAKDMLRLSGKRGEGRMGKNRERGAVRLPKSIVRLVDRFYADAAVDVANIQFLADIATHYVTLETFQKVVKLAKLEVKNGTTQLHDVVASIASQMPEYDLKDIIASLAGRVETNKTEISDQELRLKLMKETAKWLNKVADAREGVFPEPKNPQDLRDLEARKAWLNRELYKAKKSLQMAHAVLSIQKELGYEHRIANIEGREDNLRVLGDELQRLKYLKKVTRRIERLEKEIENLSAKKPKGWKPEDDVQVDEVTLSPWTDDPDTESLARLLDEVETEFFDKKAIAGAKDRLQEYRDKIDYVTEQIKAKKKDIDLPKAKPKKVKSEELEAVERQIKVARQHFNKLVAQHQKREFGDWLASTARGFVLLRPISWLYDIGSNAAMMTEGTMEKVLMIPTKHLETKMLQRYGVVGSEGYVAPKSTERFKLIMEKYPERVKKAAESLMAGTDYNHETRYEDIIYSNKITRLRGTSDLAFREYHRSGYILDFAIDKANTDLRGQKRSKDEILDYIGEIFDQAINDKDSGPLSDHELTALLVDADEWAKQNTFNNENVYSRFVDHLRKSIDSGLRIDDAKGGAAALYNYFVPSTARETVGFVFRFSRVIGNVAWVNAQYVSPTASAIAVGAHSRHLLRAVSEARADAAERGQSLNFMPSLVQGIQKMPLAERKMMKRLISRGLWGFALRIFGAWLYSAGLLEPDLAEPERGGKPWYRFDTLGWGIPENMGGMAYAVLGGAALAKTRRLESDGLLHRDGEKNAKMSENLQNDLILGAAFDTPFFKPLGLIREAQQKGYTDAFKNYMKRELTTAVSVGAGVEAAQILDRMENEGIYSRKKETLWEFYMDRLPYFRQMLEPNIDKRYNDYKLSTKGDDRIVPKEPQLPRIALPDMPKLN